MQFGCRSLQYSANLVANSCIKLDFCFLIDNIGVNAAWVIKFYLKGKLSNDEMVQYLRSQVSSLEYLNQASNFSPDVRQKLQAIRNTSNYKNLYAM